MFHQRNFARKCSIKFDKPTKFPILSQTYENFFKNQKEIFNISTPYIDRSRGNAEIVDLRECENRQQKRKDKM